MLTLFNRVLSKALYYIFGLYIEKGVLPLTWKMVISVPIQKKANKQLFQMCILPSICGKILNA